MSSVSGRAVVRHARYCSSGSHGALVHVHGPPLVPVPSVRVSEFVARRMRRLGPADRFKVLGVAIKAGVLSVRSGATLLYLWLTLKPVPSKQRRLKVGQSRPEPELGQLRTPGSICLVSPFGVKMSLLVSIFVPVVRVGLLSSRLWKTTPLSGIEV